jgi:hypothetical protein
MAITKIEWKRGDSFVIDEPGMLVEDPNGTQSMTVDGVAVRASPIDMTGWTVKSHIRRKDTGALIAECVHTWTNRAYGAYRLAVMDTSAWPLRVLAWDIEFTDPNGFVGSTKTVYIQCIKDETRAV